MLYVFGKKKIDIPHLVHTVSRPDAFPTSDNRPLPTPLPPLLLVFYDVAYSYAIPEVEKAMEGEQRGNVVFARVERENTRGQIQMAVAATGKDVCGTSECSPTTTTTTTTTTKQSFDEAMGCGDGNCNNDSTCTSSFSTSSEQLEQLDAPTNPPTNPNNTNNNDITNTSTTTNSTEAHTTSTTDSYASTTTLNGRTFELLPGTSLQDYIFLCIHS